MDANSPMTGTASVMLDMEKVETRHLNSHEMTKHTDVASGPMNSSSPANSPDQTMCEGGPSFTHARTLSTMVASSICHGASAKGDEVHL